MSHLSTAHEVFDLEIQALQATRQRLGSPFEQAVEILLATLASPRKIVVLGVGKSGNIGHKIAATLNSTGATAVVLNSQNALHGDLGMVSEGDAVLALSQSGETPELLALLPYLLREKVHLIALTGAPKSTLARQATLTLDTQVEREACPLNLAPTSSSTVMLVLGDALAMALLQARGFQREDFARYHPGGSLGRALLTRVADIMRTSEELATVGPTDSVHQALLEMTRRHSGACLIVGEEGKLEGIFTHGDFARAYQQNPDLGPQPIAELMTRQPISVRQDALAVEALNLVRERRIDDLVVLGEAGQLVGLVDSQDFARHRLL